jgi:hypothetical protein
MYQASSKLARGWRAGFAGRLVTLRLGPRTPTKPARKLAGQELEQAKARLLERYKREHLQRFSPTSDGSTDEAAD